MHKRWLQWLIIWLAMSAAGFGIGGVLHFQGAVDAASIMRWFTAALSFGWLCWGLWCWRDRRTVRMLSWMIVGAWAIVFVFLATVFSATGTPRGSIVEFIAAGLSGYTVAMLGAWGTAIAFFVGLWLIRHLLSPGYAVLGVARTLVDEAIRMKIALVFIILLVLVVPVMFVVLDPAQRLEYRLQIFLTWSLTATSLLLSLMTIFLACGTICHEVNQRQIFLTMTKPVGRWEYLLGKWVGIVLVNALLLTVSGGGIYVFTKFLQRQQARDLYDRRAVDHQVMVARVSAWPTPASNQVTRRLFEERRKQLEAQDAERFAPGKLSESDRKEIGMAVLQQWHTITRLGAQRYVFRGLDRAKDYGDTVQLRFKPKSSKRPPDGMVQLALYLNGRPFPQLSGYHIQQPVSHGDFHVIDLPVSAIDHQGNLEVGIRNLNLANPNATWPASVSFAPREGLEILYQVGAFEPNLMRALVVLWIRFAFLAVLGLMAGTFLGFPVACLLCLLVYTMAATSGFLSEALSYYAVSPSREAGAWQMIISFLGLLFENVGEGKVWASIKMLIKIAGQGSVLLVPKFSSFDPVPLISGGRLVPFTMVGYAFMKIGLLWSGVCALIALLVFRYRELARVTV